MRGYRLLGQEPDLRHSQAIPMPSCALAVTLSLILTTKVCPKSLVQKEHHVYPFRFFTVILN